MNDYKIEVHRGPRVLKKKGTRCYDKEKVLTMGKNLFKKDRRITKIVFTQEKKNNKLILKKNLFRTKYQDIKIPV